MGNTNSQQVADNISKNIASNLVQAIQSSTNNANLLSAIKGSCTPEAISAADNSYLTCLDYMISAGRTNSNDIKDICGPLINCTITDVDMTQAVYITNSSEQQADITSNLKNNVINALAQFKNDKTDQAITNVADSIVTNSTQVTQLILNNASATQVIDVNNIMVKGITMSQCLQDFSNNLQKITAVQDTVNTLANTVTQSSVSTLNTAITIGVIVISLFLVIFLILLLSKSRDLQEFFHKLIPLLTWFIIVTIITVLHVLIKPSYVSYTMPGQKDKKLDISKLLMYMFLYYVATAILVWTFFKIIRRGQDGGEYYEQDSERRGERDSERKKSTELPEEL